METTPTRRTAIERRRPVGVASGTAVAHVVVVAKEDYASVTTDDVRQTNGCVSSDAGAQTPQPGRMCASAALCCNVMQLTYWTACRRQQVRAARALPRYIVVIPCK